jgi:hypothetical protein
MAGQDGAILLDIPPLAVKSFIIDNPYDSECTFER